MTKCTIISHYGAYIVEFKDGKTILLQNDFDKASFAVSCGLIIAPDGWDGCPLKLGEAWENCDMEDIEKCPDDYYDVAEFEE